MSAVSTPSAYPLTPRVVLTTTIAAWATVVLYQLVAQRVLGVDLPGRYPEVFRSAAAFEGYAVFALLGSLLGTAALVLLYGRWRRTGGIGEALRFGLLISGFYFFGVTLTLYAQLNVGSEMLLLGGGRWVVGMLLGSVVIGALAKPRPL